MKNKISFDFTARAEVAAWVHDLDQAMRDLLAVAEDQTAPFAQRDLGRRQARTIIGESMIRIETLLACARAGLESDADAEDPVGS